MNLNPISKLLAAGSRHSVLLLLASSAWAAAPDQYVLQRSVANLGAATDRRIPDTVLFNDNGEVVYRVIATGAVATPLGTFFNSVAGGGAEVQSPGGYDVVEATSLNASGTVVGKASTDDNLSQTAFVWTAALGPFQAEGTDPGSSSFKSINSVGTAFGAQDPGTFELITWKPDANPGNPPVVTPIVPPTLTTGLEPISINGKGEVLYLGTAGGLKWMIIWDGTVSTFVGPPVPLGSELFPANAAINEVGDVVALVVNPTTEIYRLIVVRAEDRNSWEFFDFPRRADSVFALQLNNFAQVAFGTSGGKVEFIDTKTKLSVAFDGYRGLLSSAGVLLYGLQGKLHYWDTLVPAVPPVIVPVQAGAVKQSPDVIAVNAAGQIVVRLARSTNENGDALEVFAPAAFPPTPVIVNVSTKRNVFRFDQGDRVSKKVARYVVAQGGSRIQGRIRYAVQGELPVGVRFRKNRGRLAGKALQRGKFVLDVFAQYRVDGQLVRSNPAQLAIRVRRGD